MSSNFPHKERYFYENINGRVRRFRVRLMPRMSFLSPYPSLSVRAVQRPARGHLFS